MHFYLLNQDFAREHMDAQSPPIRDFFFYEIKIDFYKTKKLHIRTTNVDHSYGASPREIPEFHGTPVICGKISITSVASQTTVDSFKTAIESQVGN